MLLSLAGGSIQLQFQFSRIVRRRLLQLVSKEFGEFAFLREVKEDFIEERYKGL